MYKFYLEIHTIIADKTGNAFILEEGNDKNIISPIQNNKRSNRWERDLSLL